MLFYTFDHFRNLLSFIGNDPIVSHNCAFDIRFLVKEVERVNQTRQVNNAPLLPVPNTNAYFCTMSFFRHQFPKHNYDLDSVCYYFGVSLQSRSRLGNHSALVDAMMVCELYMEIRKVYFMELNQIAVEQHQADEEVAEDDEPPRKKIRFLL